MGEMKHDPNRTLFALVERDAELPAYIEFCRRGGGVEISIRSRKEHGGETSWIIVNQDDWRAMRDAISAKA